MPPLNLTSTQKGYVPLEDRFKSFPPDSEKSPVTDEKFYFDNYANQTLEKATIDLLYPTPAWLRRKLQKQGLIQKYLETGSGQLLLAGGKFLIVSEFA